MKKALDECFFRYLTKRNIQEYKANDDKIIIPIQTKTAVNLRFSYISFEYSLILIFDYSAR